MLKWLTCVAMLLAGQLVQAQQDLKRDSLASGEYYVLQSWSQEESFERPYYVRVPDAQDKQRQLPVLIFLHGNGGNAPEAMRGFIRGRRKIASRYVMVCPQGYRESWNIVSERSKADDLGFIEAIVLKLATFENVDPNSFTIMGSSNGAALVNQLAIESKVPNIRNYISGVSQLNAWQYDGTHFKAKGDDNNYRKVANPAKGKRLLNISGVKDKLVPYHGGFSNAIPAKDGKLAFVDAEESTFLWARQMGYEGEQLHRPSRTIENVELFRYLDGDVVHYKVTNEGHGATYGISEQLLLDFLDATNEVNGEMREMTERIDEAVREQRRFKRLEAVIDQKITLLRELRQLHASIQPTEATIEAANRDDQVERIRKTVEQSEVLIEIVNLKLEVLERRLALEELALEVAPDQRDVAKEVAEQLKMLDAANDLTDQFGNALLEEREDSAGELEREFVKFERAFQRRRETLQLRFELIEAREDGDQEWIRELETEPKELDAADHTATTDDFELSNGDSVTIPITNPSFESASAGWSGLTIGTSEYYAAPNGTSYAACPGTSGYISQLTNHTIASGSNYTLTVWARSINVATNSAATHAEVRLYHGSSTIAVVSHDVYPRRLSGAPATIHNDDGGNVWLDGNYRMSSAQHIFYQTRDKHPINDPWFDAGEHPHGCGTANIMTPEGLNAIYGCTGYNEETLYSGQDFSTFSGRPPFYAFSVVGEPVVCHEDNENPWIIDAHLYYDDDTGRLWMTWGGGTVYVSELDPRDGFLINHPAKPWFDTHPPGTHTKVAVWDGDQWSADWVEGPSLYKHNGFWYLFLTCGNMNADYTIRMGRSISPTGPYFDKDGVGLLEYDSGENRHGNSILLGDEGEYLVPGHPHLWNEKSTSYMGYDYRPNSTNMPDIMGIRRLYWVNDWPTIWTPITVTFNANDHLDAVGQTLGISMRNTGSGSTAAFDHVTLTVAH